MIFPYQKNGGSGGVERAEVFSELADYEGKGKWLLAGNLGNNQEFLNGVCLFQPNPGENRVCLILSEGWMVKYADEHYWVEEKEGELERREMLVVWLEIGGDQREMFIWKRREVREGEEVRGEEGKEGKGKVREGDEGEWIEEKRIKLVSDSQYDYLFREENKGKGRDYMDRKAEKWQEIDERLG